MTTSSAVVSSFSLLQTSLGSTTPAHQPSLYNGFQRQSRIGNKPISFRVRAAKVPAGVEMPKSEPKLSPPFLGFTKTAEIWNSRACMIGLIGTFIVELILNKGILQMIGVEIGKGLDLPL